MIVSVIQLLYYSLFLFTPLIMSSFTSELFEFNKMIFIYLSTVIILFLWITAMIKSQKIIWKRTVLDLPIWLFLGSQILSTIFSMDRHTSVFGYYGRFNGGLLSIITYIILFYGFINFFDQKSIAKLLKVSVIGSILVILWGMPGKFNHDMSCLLFTGQFNNACWTDQFQPESRMFSTLGQPNWLGAYLAINFFIGLYFLVISKKNIPLYFYLLLNFATILFTRSRSALIAVLTGFLLFSLLRLISNRQAYRQLLKLILIFIIPIIIFKTDIAVIDKYLTLPAFKTASPQKQANISNVNVINIKITGSLDIRKIVWEGALQLGKKYPLFGTGVETFAYAYYFVRPVSHNLTSEWDYLYNKAHNEYLNYFATTGYIGLGSYLLMIGVVIIFLFVGISNFQFPIFKQIPNSKSKIDYNEKIFTTCLLAAYITILITNFIGFSTTTINLYFYLIPAIIIASQTEQLNLPTKELNNRARFLVLTSFAVTLFAIMYFIKYFIADVTFAKADVYNKLNNYQQSAALFTQALQLKYEPVYEDRLSYTLANLAVIASYNNEKTTAKKLVAAADSYNQKTIQESPKNILYWKTKAKNQYLFYQVTLDNKQLETGIYALNEARKLSPTDPKIPYSLSIFYSLLADNTKDRAEKVSYENKAIDNIKRSTKLKPDYADAFTLKTQLLKKYSVTQ